MLHYTNMYSWVIDRPADEQVQLFDEHKAWELQIYLERA